ncbi:MAG: [FeFe] hydrogenase, group A [Ruminococcus sp.]|uniref:[FeFe] hydrogenase, group A n=1 Tax=Ruminococcus sp. TaxID=41978 RepID=UPI0025E202E1|nr:[FeFe] hydrogenase, group A [Ruminococcus sp.]MCR5601259.1 [FeFe] hydrogenase, group A [Ruminococcus sp.]
MQLDNFIEIDGKLVKIEGERNLLEVISKSGIKLPVFCYHSDLSIYGACRMCMVEDEKGRMMAACSTVPRGGMIIKTNTARLRKYRKGILELLLASHCRDCTTCENSGKCTLQELAVQFGITNVRFNNDKTNKVIDDSSPSIIRDSSKCILCGDCVRECNEVQKVGAIDFAHRGSNATISTAFNKPIAESLCVNCGQCAAHCPTGAIIVRDDSSKVLDMIDDPEVFVTCEIAPAVRVGIGKELGLELGDNTMGKITAVLHRIGVDKVFDTATGADLTVIEEAGEFVERVQNGGTLPLLTSCCPAWVSYVEKKYPEMLPNISTCRSPMSMFSAVVKEYYKDKLPEGKTKHYHFALMPCTAKKFEAKRDEFEGVTNDVITTQELIKIIKESGIMFNEIEPESVDMPFGTASGAGVIFGVTGGVTEAVLRKVANDNSRKALAQIEYVGVRGMEDVKEAVIPFGERELHIAVVSGLANASKLIEGVKKGELNYDLIEVMACRGGCISGAGQPYISHRHREKRGEGLYRSDRESSVKCSQDNRILGDLYDFVMKDKIHELLHVSYVK